MPRISYLSAALPQVNSLAALFKAYRKQTGMTSAEIAEKVGCSPENARYQMNKPGREWNVGQLCKYCDALGIPYYAAFEAAAK